MIITSAIKMNTFTAPLPDRQWAFFIYARNKNTDDTDANIYPKKTLIEYHYCNTANNQKEGPREMNPKNEIGPIKIFLNFGGLVRKYKPQRS